MDNHLNQKRILGLPRNVFTLGWVSFFMDVSSEMIYPLLPLFLTNILGANKAMVGLIEGIAESTASLLKVVSGYLSDKFRKRKPLILYGYGLSTLTRPIVAIATGWAGVLVYRFMDRIGKGIRTAPRDAIIAESTEAGSLGKAFGFHRAMDTCGAIVGPAIAIAVLYLYGHSYPSEPLPAEAVKGAEQAFRTLFWLSMIPGLAAVVLIILFVKEKAHPLSTEHPTSLFRHSIMNSDFRKFLIVVGVFTLGNSSNAFLILKMQDAGAGMLNITGLYLLFNAVYSAASLPAGMAADRFGKKRMILGSYILFALIYSGLAFSKTQTSVWALLIAYGIFMGISEGIQRAFVATLLSNNSIGTGYGIYHTLTGLVTLPASLIAGLLWDRIGPQATFLFGAVTGTLAAVLFLLFFWKSRGTGRQS
ncbi:MAG: MFS transporter [Nitrospirota bacterium]|nr:MFS transporter [Nitrospirota bacterium]